jgi:hypothetical protein
LGETPWWVTYAAGFLAAIAVISLFLAIYEVKSHQADQQVGYEVIRYYIFWLLSVGAIGATSFIAMNALSLQEDATFDITNTRLMVLRIALGGLFALMLCIPFGFYDFVAFCKYLLAAGSASKGSPTSTPVTDATQSTLMLLLPFILGFSTSVVIMILNRFVDAVQTFFGRSSAAVSSTPSSARSPIP